MADTPKPCCLTVAGSDSGGNAGVQADLRMFHAYGLHGCTVFTALTAQNPFGVSAVHPVPADFVTAQLDAVLGVYNIRAMKTGMVVDPVAIEAVADRLASHPEIACVVDPVMIATCGARLSDSETIKAVTTRLLPHATILTPNLPEADALCGTVAHAAQTRADVRDRARCLYEKFGCAVLVKGGHSDEAEAVDVLCQNGELTEFALPRIHNPISTHGTGCSLAAALAAELARGASLTDAVKGAKESVRRAIETSYLVGSTCGVLGFL